ncbi:TRAP transporter substrate-binding protein [Ancylobacter mangrovi]|uniref:TRAP transporter substrate-binding protein n=1 Tax=Ancylobacter mangrovi TaxID=2972472 RepID=UPI0021639A29|nr:TRAP transporter substrate-binding protein [Ancylobacter mangrovi]MCS0502001.1 TRAP transporter substrate-binding protein [Ancylobacter mangrovi]
MTLLTSKFLAPIAVTCLLALPAHAATVNFTLGTENNSSDFSVQAMQHWKKLLADRSNGELQMTIVDGGALGSGVEVLQQLSNDEIQVSISGPTLVHSMAKPYQCMEAEFVYDDADHGYRVWTGKLGKELSDYMTKNYDITISGVGYRGARVVTANKPIREPSDLQGLKIRVTNPLRSKVFAAFGALPGPLPYSELYGALRQGVFDSQENPISAIFAQKFYEVQKTVDLTDHVQSYYIVTTNTEFLDGLSDEQRKIFNETAAETMTWLNALVKKQEGELLDEIKKAGVEVVKSDVPAFKKIAEPIVQDFAAKNCRPGILDDIAAAK